MHEFMLSLDAALANGLVWLIFAILSLLVMKFISGKKKDARYAALALSLVKNLIGDKLGPKANAVLSVWQDGLKMISTGTYTDEEMVDEFVKFVKDAAFSKTSTTLTPADLTTVRAAAVTTIGVSKISPEPAKVIVHEMSVAALSAAPPVIVTSPVTSYSAAYRSDNKE
jgi:hypothetical protein